MKRLRRHTHAIHHRALLATYDLKRAPAVFGYSRAPYLSRTMFDWRPYEIERTSPLYFSMFR